MPATWTLTAGQARAPNAEVRFTNGLDFWVESRTNSLGLLDREPIGIERAAASCHVAVIGDSFVDAPHVPIADKLHVRLEELAARELRHLDVATSAFGIGATGQVNQLAYWDEFARHLRPDLVALFFVPNDFMNNSPILEGLRRRIDPDRLRNVSATRGVDGAIALRPPHPQVSRLVERRRPRASAAEWLDAKTYKVLAPPNPELVAAVELLSRRSPATCAAKASIGGMRSRRTNGQRGGPCYV